MKIGYSLVSATLLSGLAAFSIAAAPAYAALASGSTTTTKSAAPAKTGKVMHRMSVKHGKKTATSNISSKRMKNSS